MKKIAPVKDYKSGTGRPRKLQLTAETVRLLSAEALAQAVSGCDSTTNPTQAPAKSTVGC